MVMQKDPLLHLTFRLKNVPQLASGLKGSLHRVTRLSQFNLQIVPVVVAKMTNLVTLFHRYMIEYFVQNHLPYGKISKLSEKIHIGITRSCCTSCADKKEARSKINLEKTRK